ncbi:MAG: ATP-dependent DNA helicase, partial [Alphaproteobacteria bacterium]|nr:ATP-dependent DNA helicase [Alphaproteobacteria bacterium]
MSLDEPRVVAIGAPCLVVGPQGALLLSAEGELRELDRDTAARVAPGLAPLVCHARATARRLGLTRLANAWDVLELYAFLYPVTPLAPTARGLAQVLGLDAPRGLAEEAVALYRATEVLLARLANAPERARAEVAPIAATMARAGWPWGPAVLAACGAPSAVPGGLDIFRRLPEWEELPPPPPPGDRKVEPDAARRRLAALTGPEAEKRTAQSDFAAAAAAAFDPREVEGAPNMVLVEAGTGVGKTLGYLAPASLWAEANTGPVWISTYTKNLQRQVDQELDRLFPDRGEKARRVVIRKGRENYLCLLNYEEAVGRAALDPTSTLALGLIARWLRATRDGDMVGGDFPAWLLGLIGAETALGLTDKRGECVFAACAHYRRCFIERSRRAAAYAALVISNHALTMIEGAWYEGERLPTRYVFDEGHHLFDAADGVFAADLSGAETAELRRWLRGVEGGRRGGRARGLKARLDELIAGDATAEAELGAAVEAAGALPGEGWLARLKDERPTGPTEGFLQVLRRVVVARSAAKDEGYDLEAPSTDPPEDLLAAARHLAKAFDALGRPMAALVQAIAALLDREAAELDGTAKTRLDAMRKGIANRLETLRAWRAMLRDLGQTTPPDYVDWFALVREFGRDRDVAYRRSWLDPTKPLATSVFARAHGVVITSATLRDRDPASPDDWATAETRTGAQHLPRPALRAGFPSPFDYAARTRVFVVTDVPRDNAD